MDAPGRHGNAKADADRRGCEQRGAAEVHSLRADRDLEQEIVGVTPSAPGRRDLVRRRRGDVGAPRVAESPSQERTMEETPDVGGVHGCA